MRKNKTKWKQAHRHREQTGSWEGKGECWGEVKYAEGVKSYKPPVIK